jgi:hypothetical protein
LNIKDGVVLSFGDSVRNFPCHLFHPSLTSFSLTVLPRPGPDIPHPQCAPAC